jgi:sugar/nucleoside kinase (ribokinase family)
MNLEEAGLLCQTTFTSSSDAAAALLAKGAARVLVTDGGSDASEGTDGEIISQTPPKVLVTRITGAGDTFMAAHIAAESRGADRKTALTDALKSAATYVSGEPI